MAKIEIDEQELKKVISNAIIEMMTNKSTSVVWEEGDLSEIRRNGDIDQEFEEAIRGDLMNLRLVKKYLDKVRPTAKTKDEYLKAMNIIEMDISNLDKFVEERWGNGEEE